MTTTHDDLVTHGPVLCPGDAGYDDARSGYNRIVEHHPDVIVGATGPADVIAAVDHARRRSLPVAVQATGHGVSIAADGAVLVDTSRMSGVRVDPARRTARIEAGVRSGKLVHEAWAHGLAPLNGSAPDVGTVSYVLGGGVAMLGRRFGYAADHVRSIDVVTADGRFRTTSAELEPDLFWALRGGKGNFGVVTSMEIDLVPVDRLHGGGLWFAADDTADLLHAYADWTDTVPEAMGSSVLMIRLPDVDGVPDPLRGRYVAHVRIAHSGPADEGAELVAPLRRVAPPLLDTVTEMPYREVGTIHAEPTFPVPFHSRNTVLGRLDHDAVEALLGEAGPGADAPYLVELRHLGGALARPAEQPNAIGRREGAFILYSGSVMTGQEPAAVRAAHDRLHTTMAPWGTGGVCANFLSGPEVTPDQLRSGYLPADWDRLTAIKGAVDPDNVFRINHNIPPAG